MSRASDIYNTRRNIVCQTREDEKEFGVTKTWPQSWGGGGNRVYFWEIKGVVDDYLSAYISKDNLLELCFDYLFVQDYEISHQYQKEKREQVVNSVVDVFLSNETKQYQTDLENGLCKCLEYILSEEHLYFVAMDYLMHSEEMGMLSLFKDDVKEKLLETVRRVLKQNISVAHEELKNDA